MNFFGTARTAFCGNFVVRFVVISVDISCEEGAIGDRNVEEGILRKNVNDQKHSFPVRPNDNRTLGL